MIILFILVLHHFEEEEKELVDLLLLSKGFLAIVNVLCLFLTVPWVGLCALCGLGIS